MADAKVSLEKLNDRNFAVWKFKMELLLTKEGLMGIVSDPKPETAVGQAEWLVNDGKARAMIGLAVEDEQLVHIIRKQTAKEMWEALKKIHEESSLSTTLHVLRKLCSLRMPEEGDLPEHLNDMTALHNRLEVMGEGLKDRVFMALILSSLPPSFGSLINVIENRAENELTVDFVKSKLRDEWRRRRECGHSECEKEKALKLVKSSASVGAKPKTTQMKKKKICYLCGEEGHFRRVAVSERPKGEKWFWEGKVGCRGSKRFGNVFSSDKCV